MCQVIVFSLAARQRLEQRLARSPELLGTRMNDIESRLRLIFSEGEAVIVQDLYGGYRVHDDEYVLLVELTRSGDHDGRYVVKLGPTDRLLRELKAWRECRPTGLRHDLVLMPIDPRPDAEHPVGLVYVDAQQFIGVDQTLALESAMLDSARLGLPTPGSVADVLFQLYERLGVVLYRYSANLDPPAPRVGMTLTELGYDRRLSTNLAHWTASERIPFEVRAYANTPAADSPVADAFRDPVDFFRAVGDHLRDGGNPADLIPIVRVGRGHGDLHGRNVMVGRVGDGVLWPAVYDHEHMSRENLIGWDFVKLETEFKIRAYPTLFPGLPKTSVAEVLAFERDLFARTEEFRESGVWPDHPAADDHQSRVAWLVLKIREAACRHLGLLRARSREWLMEYYFLLTLYGLNSIRYTNLESPQLLSAYLSSGAACARYVHDLERRDIGGRFMIALSYHAELERAKTWRFEQTEQGLSAAKATLEGLCEKYPHVLAIGHELILVLEKLGDLDGASRELRRLERVFPKLDEETLSRGGKIHKLLAATAPLGQAIAYLRTAEDYYHRGYALSGGCYSRINELTVRLLRAAKLAESGNVPEAQDILSKTREVAAEFLKTDSWVAHRSDDNIWIPATQGEAAFLAGDWPAAERAYSRAKLAAAGKVFYLRAMRDQLKLLVEAYAKLNVIPSSVLADADAFFGLPEPSPVE